MVSDAGQELASIARAEAWEIIRWQYERGIDQATAAISLAIAAGFTAGDRAGDATRLAERVERLSGLFVLYAKRGAEATLSDPECIDQ
jgi:hypothetical protein